MRILLTGATGFLGSHTAEALLRHGHQVEALVQRDSEVSFLKKIGAHLLQGDLHHLEILDHVAPEFDAVVHLAGKRKAANKNDFLHANASGTANLVREILQRPHRPKKFLYVSTIAVHNPEQGPDFCLASTDCHPLSDYGLSKLRGELALRPLQGKIPSVILRLPLLYGPRDRELLPLFRAIRWGLAPLFQRGENRLSLCYVRDTAEAIAQLLESPKAQDEIYCLDDGSVHTWKSFCWNIGQALSKRPRFLSIPQRLFQAATWGAEKYAELSEKSSPLNRGKMLELAQPRWICGRAKLERSLTWLPEYDLKRGLAETHQNYRESGWI